MSVIYLLLGVSLLLAVFFLFVFIRSAKKGQFDDDYTPSVRILFDDLPEKTSNKPKSKS